MRTTLIILTLSLSVLVAFQWSRESALRVLLTEMEGKLQAAQAEASDAQDKLRTWEEEITRLTEKAEASATKSAGLEAEVTRLTAALQQREAEPPPVAAPDAAALEKRKREVAAQNEAILKQNAALKELAAERDALAGKLNERIRAWNELSAKYADLQKQRRQP